MIHKVMDSRRVTHYNVLGFKCLVTPCNQGVAGRDLSPASWRRQVDCMTCLVNVAAMTWCGHGTGEVIRVDRVTYRVYRQCHRCTFSECVT